VKCWGRKAITSKALVKRIVEDVRTAKEIITSTTGNPPNLIMTSMENVERINPELAERLKQAGPDVEVPIKPNSKRAEKISSALAQLESSLKRGSEIPPPKQAERRPKRKIFQRRKQRNA
jgi:hypothetical protein